MGNHPFNLIVILFWLATMSWLVVVKVLPPLRVGEPPNYSSIVSEQADKPACWSVHLNDQLLGWAATKVVRRKDGITELYARVYLSELPLEEIAPPWLGNILKPVLREIGAMDFDKKTRLTLDPLGRLVGLDSKVRIANLQDAIKVTGQIEGSALTLTVLSGDYARKLETSLPADALMTDELSPQTNMPGLRVGQTWTVPLYNPLRPPSSPIEILQAVVEREDRITWDGQGVNTRVVVYRKDPGSGLIGNETRGRIWVGKDGLVLRQEVTVLRSHVRFVRLAEGQSDGIVTALGNDWMGSLSSESARSLLDAMEEAVAP